MQNILIAVLAASISAGIITALGTGGKAEKYLRYFSALLLTLAILSPLCSFFQNGFSFSELFPEGDNAHVEAVPQRFLRQFETEIEKAVSALLEDEFLLAKGDCLPIATAEDRDGMPVLLQVELRVYTLRGALLTGKIRECLEKACGCKIVITEEVGA